MDVRLPDGTIVRNVPDGTTKAELAAKLQRNGMAVPAGWMAAGAPSAPKTEREKYDPTEGMSTTDKVLAGIGKGMTDIAQGVGQAFGLVSREDVAEKRALDAALMNTGAGKTGNFIGNAAVMLPAALIPGANTIVGGTLIGGASGFLQPSTSTSETMSNTLLGGVAGGAVPTLIRGAQVTKSLLDPFRASGRDQIVGNALVRAAGNGSDDAIRNLSTARSSIPGLQPTAAEVARNPGIAALQRTATAIDPVAMNANVARQAANNEARIAALRALAGDKEASIAAREAATEALYAASRGKTITLTSELESLIQRPVMQSAISQAKNLAANEGSRFSLKAGTPAQPSALLGANGAPIGMTPARPGSLIGRDAHTIKRALDDTIEGLAGQQGLGRNAKRAATSTKEAFLGEVEKQVPEYGLARQTFAQMSRPINQADVAEAILQRSTGNIQGNMTPAAFNRALSDRTAQSALGRKGATLADVFDAPQMQTLNDIKGSLAGLDFANSAGRGVGSDTVQKLAYSNILDQSGIPNFIRSMGPSGVVGNLLQRGGQIAYKDANDAMAERMANALLDPRVTAELMRKGVTNPTVAQIQSAIKKVGVIAGSGSAGLLAAEPE